MIKRRDRQIAEILNAAEPNLQFEFSKVIASALDRFPRLGLWREDEQLEETIEMAINILTRDSLRRWKQKLERIADINERTGMRIVYLQSRTTEVLTDE